MMAHLPGRHLLERYPLVAACVGTAVVTAATLFLTRVQPDPVQAIADTSFAAVLAGMAVLKIASFRP